MTRVTERVSRRNEIAAQVEQIERDLGGIRHAMRKPLEAEVSKGELTIPQKAVMQVVVRNPGTSLKDIACEVSLAHSTVSGIVDRLQKRGMIERRVDEADGRVVRIYPTAEVQAFVHDLIPALTRGPLERALERTTESEREAIGQALRRLRELLEDE
jgi:DNA-binding MarR family transcriptional regulator